MVRVGVGVFRPQSGSPNHLLLDFQVRRGPCLGERRFDNETIRCFLDTQVSLAPTQWVVPMSDVSPSVGWSHFRISILSASLGVTERPQRLVTFETFDQSDEVK